MLEILRINTAEDVFLQVCEMATGLLAIGIEKGDRVGMWGQNYYEWMVIQYSTALCGIIQVNINPFYKAPELEYALRKVGVKALVTPKAHKQNKFYDVLAEVLPSITTGKAGLGTVESSKLPDLKHILVFGEKEKLPGAWQFDEIWKAGGTYELSMLDEVRSHVLPEDPVNIQYTSGTTGLPKAATLSHFNIINNSFLIGLTSGWHEENHRICIPNPLYHCFGCVIGALNALNHNQTCVFPSISYDTKAILESISKEKCTFIFGTPTMFIDLLSTPFLKTADISSLRGGYIAGAPCPLSLCKQMVDHLNMNDIYVLYGTTELSPGVSMSVQRDEPEERIKSVGHVLPSTEVVIVDNNNRVVPRGEKGELWARGYMTMSGYWGDEEKTKKEITPQNWYKTGDTAIMNENGTINIIGRNKDMIVKGGENVYPTEIETAMFKFPYIADVQIVGVPDERYGENICGWVRLKEQYVGKVNEDHIKEDCKKAMAYYKVPKYLFIKEQKDFPLTATGKVKKFELRSISKSLLGLENSGPHFSSAHI
ncbi:unnamed protein product [Auanema sp. JU1783]|nr:unnamed protein product [Auanema sp. JU1783]